MKTGHPSCTCTLRTRVSSRQRRMLSAHISTFVKSKKNVQYGPYFMQLSPLEHYARGSYSEKAWRFLKTPLDSVKNQQEHLKFWEMASALRSSRSTKTPNQQIKEELSFGGVTGGVLEDPWQSRPQNIFTTVRIIDRQAAGRGGGRHQCGRRVGVNLLLHL